MRGTQSLYYTNPGPGGLRQVVVEEDPRQAVKVYSAGDFISEARARELGIYEWMLGAGDPGPQSRALAVDDPEAQSRHAGEAAAKVRAASVERQPMRGTSVEERAYVENAVSQPIQLSAAERGEAGAMGAESTGPTMPEIAEAGSAAVATDKASADMTGGQTPAPTGERGRRTPPPPPSPADDPTHRP